MSGFALPGLAAVTAGLLGLGVLSGLATARLAHWGTLIVCGSGALMGLVYLLTGAAPASLVIPVGLAGQSTILALDGVSGLFGVLLMLSGAAAAAAALDDHGHPQATTPAFPVFLGAMLLTLLAGDAFAMVFGFELMSLASFILVVSFHRDPAVRAAGLLYLGMAALAGVCLIAALALLAGHGASFAAIRAHPPEGWRAIAILALALIGPGSKAGLAPLHVWLPPAHAAAPGHVSALMSGAMTKIAIYVLIRVVFDLCGPAQPLWWGLPLLVMGVASAVLGAMRANIETDIKAVLACSTVENIGLITVGLGLALAARAADLSALAGLALGAALLHVIAHGLFKTMLFLGAGAIQYGAGSRLMPRLGGLLSRMPITGCCMLFGAACLAGLPPSAGFASEWMLLQSVLGAVRLGGLGLQIVVCVLAACLALAIALAGCAAVRLVGVALLGRPRSPQAGAAQEAGPSVRWALLGLAALVGLISLFPGGVLGLAAPALRALANTSMADRADVWGLAATVQSPSYVPLAVIALLVVFGAGTLLLLRARAVPGHRTAPAWDCGFGAPPAFLPFGDPLTQYSGGSFAQPLRRILGPVLLSATASVDMPAPGDIRAAVFAEHAADPAELYVFAPIAGLRARLSAVADRMQFLTVRQILSVMVTALILFLVVIAILEQL